MVRLLIAGIVLALAGAAQPARIVSTSPSITETLFAVDLGDRVVGVSNHCRYPSAALSLPKIGTYTRPDAEKIALLHPDLVIIHKSATVLAAKLSALKIPYAEVKVGSLAETYSMISDIGRAAGVADRAARLNREIQSRLDAFRVEVKNQAKPAALIIVGRNPGMLTNLVAVGAGPYLAELLEIAGGANVLSDSAIAYPHISLETVIRLNPDVILDLSITGDPGADSVKQGERLREPWLTRRELSAVRNGRIFGLASEALITPGPRVVDAVKMLREKIHEKDHRQ
jgi:iron complex transport system substrate-binding protein